MQTPALHKRHRSGVGLVAITLVGAAAYAYVFVHPFVLMADNQAYYLLAEAVMDGLGYVEAWHPTPHAANHFPPGYPALLAAWMAVAGRSVLAAKLLSGFAFGVSIVLTYRIGLRLTCDERVGLVAAALVAVNAVALRYAALVRSEVPFLAMSLLALYALIRVREANGLGEGWRWLCMLILSLAAAYYLRSVGLFLIAAVVLGSMVRRRWIEAIWISGAVGALALPWYLYGRALQGNTYVSALFTKDWFLPEQGRVGVEDIIRRVQANTWDYAAYHLPDLILPGHEMWTAGWIPVVLVMTGALLALMAYGLAVLPTLRVEIAAYIACTAGILLAWDPDWSSARFVLPLLPVLMILAVWGGHSILQRFAKEPLSPLLFFPFLVFPLMALPAEHARATQQDGYSARNQRVLFERARTTLPPDAVIAAINDAQVAYFSERKTVPFRASRDPVRLITTLDAQRARYVWLSEAKRDVYWQYVAPIIDAHPEHFELVLRVQGARNFEAYGRPLAAEVYRFYPKGDAPRGEPEQP